MTNSASFSTRRAAVDPEEVFRAANDLVQQNKPVTALALLDALGGGSLRTIYKYLAEWEKSRKEAPQVATASEIPEAVKNAFASTWKVAAAEAAKEVTAAKERAALEVAEAQKKFDEALEGIQKLEAQTEQDATLIDNLEAQVLHLQAAVTQAGNDNAALKATAEQLRHQVQSQQSELERLHKDIDADRKLHQEQLERLSADYAKLQERTASQLDQLQEQANSLQKRAEQSDRERLEVQVTFEQTNKQLAQMSEQLQISQRNHEAINKEREAALTEAAELKGQTQALKAQNADLMSKLTTRKAKEEN